MVHLRPGLCGAVLGPLLFVTIALCSYLSKKHKTYNLDPKGEPGAFREFLDRYIRVAEFIIGLATGSIVLLVGSSTLRSQGRLPWFYASPLLLLCWCVIFAVIFMVWLIFNYEEYRHGNSHTAMGYTLSESLGFSSLSCFCIGYVWLIVAVAM